MRFGRSERLEIVRRYRIPVRLRAVLGALALLCLAALEYSLT
jgi:hypothetical protein